MSAHPCQATGARGGFRGGSRGPSHMRTGAGRECSPAPATEQPKAGQIKSWGPAPRSTMEGYLDLWADHFAADPSWCQVFSVFQALRESEPRSACPPRLLPPSRRRPPPSSSSRPERRRSNRGGQPHRRPPGDWFTSILRQYSTLSRVEGTGGRRGAADGSRTRRGAGAHRPATAAGAAGPGAPDVGTACCSFVTDRDLARPDGTSGDLCRRWRPAAGDGPAAGCGTGEPTRPATRHAGPRRPHPCPASGAPREPRRERSRGRLGTRCPLAAPPALDRRSRRLLRLQDDRRPEKGTPGGPRCRRRAPWRHRHLDVGRRRPRRLPAWGAGFADGCYLAAERSGAPPRGGAHDEQDRLDADEQRLGLETAGAAGRLAAEGGRARRSRARDRQQDGQAEAGLPGVPGGDGADGAEVAARRADAHPAGCRRLSGEAEAALCRVRRVALRAQGQG